MPNNETPTLRLIRLPEVLKKVGIGRSTLFLWIKEGRFPRPIHLGTRCIAWPSDTIDSWILAKINGER